MSKESLQGMNMKDLTEKAKEVGAPRYSGGKRLTKDQLIEGILKAQGEQPQELELENDEAEPGQVETEAHEVEEQDNGLTDEERRQRHNQYVENVKVGTLVAFKTGPNKAKSAMVVKRSTKNRRLKVETKYGKELIISFDDVIWVHTNKRWPKGVYNMLKGMVENNEGTDKVD